MSRILVVDDDPALLQTLRLNLQARQYDVDTAETGEQALALAAQHQPDVAIVDLGLPDVDGLEVIAQLRRRSALPILVLSARGEQSDKIAALDAGSDDHISKPFAMGELLARVRAALRRTAPPAGAAVVTTRSFTLDFTARTATTASGGIHLTPTEWHLLEELVRQPGRVVPQLELLQAVWGPAYGHESRHYLRVYLTQLRRKLEPSPASPRHLITVPGTGYRFDP